MKSFDAMTNEVFISLKKRRIPIANCTVTINNRLSGVFGRCITKTMGGKAISHKIEIAGFLVKNGSEQGIKDTIAHEYLHTCDGCQNHGAKWKHYASIISDMYDVTRTSTAESKGIDKRIVVQRVEESYKYVVKCGGCGVESKYKRMGKNLKNLNRCICSRCGSKELKLIRL